MGLGEMKVDGRVEVEWGNTSNMRRGLENMNGVEELRMNSAREKVGRK